MSACGLQGTPKDVLSFFHPTPRRHRRREKVDNPDARNYTLKSPLSLTITRRYAADLSFQKRVSPDHPNECRDRPDEDLLTLVRRPLLPVTGAASALAKVPRNRSRCLRFQAMTCNELA